MKLWFHRGAWASQKGRRAVEQLKPEDVKSVAVIRHAALGDMILTRPFLIELRRFFPNAKITLSVSSNYTRGVPEDLVDRVHEIYAGDQRDKPFKKQIGRIKELGYHDVLFDLAATSRSFWICKLTSAKLKLGYPYHSLQRYFYDVTVPRSDLRFEADNMLDMLNVLGHVTQSPLVFDMPVESSRREMPYVIYFPSASVKEKCWPRESFFKLVEKMSVRYPDYEHILLGGRAEWESIDDIADSLSQHGNVTGVYLNDLDETMSLIKGASLLIGNDTGIRHVAIACDTPTVGIFFLTPVFRYWPRCGQHSVALTSEGGVPNVEQVLALACDQLEL